MNPLPLPAWRAQSPAGLSLAQARARLDPRLTEPLFAAPPAWRSLRAAHLDPTRLDAILQAALAGDHASQWELFDLMVDTWPRLAKGLAEVKQSIAAMRWTVQPWTEADAPPTPEAVERAALVEHALWRLRPDPAAGERDFTGLLADLADGWYTGLSLAELLWEDRDAPGLGRVWLPRAALPVPATTWTLDRDGRVRLRLPGAAPGPAYNAELPAHKFLLAAARHRPTCAVGAGLLRPLAWWWLAHTCAAEWQLNYAQLFGVPVRWANYANGAPAETVAAIGDMLANLGSAGWAAFPEGTTLQLLEGQKTSGTSPQEALQDRADRYCDLLILGQTLTSQPDQTGTQALGTVHERIRGDVLQAVADWLAGVLTQQLVPALLELNFGDTEAAPELRAEPVRQKDYLAQAQRDVLLLNAGVELPRDWFHERHDIPLPQPGEALIRRITPEPALPPFPGGPGAEAAQAARGGWAGEPPSDAVADAVGAALGRAYRGALAPVKDLILSARTPDEAYNALAAHFRDWQPARVLALTEEALGLAAAAGAASVPRR